MLQSKKKILYICLFSLSVVLLILICFFKPNKHKVIVCWGDSLTSPAYSSDIKSKLYELFRGPGDWPAFLQKDLGCDYDVINAAVAGENTLGIMLRQGSLPLYAGCDMVFDSHSGVVSHIACKQDSLFERALWGNSLLLHGWEPGNSSMFNPCLIEGREYNIQCNSHPYKNATNESIFSWLYNYYLEPLEESARYNKYYDVDTIKKGTRIHTYASNHLRSPYLNIFFVGQNGGYSSIEDLVFQIKTMVNYSKAIRFIVVSFHHTNDVIKKYFRYETNGKDFSTRIW